MSRNSRSNQHQVRMRLYAEQQNCYYCERPLKFEEATIDHITPRFGNAEWNLTIACESCNHEKGRLENEE